jgi:argininosuccinate synthase
MPETTVLAFSGGLDTSWCVPWLKENHGCDVVTVTVDVGGFDERSRTELEARAKALGAARHIWVDGRRTLFDEVLRFLLMGNVLRGQVYPLCVGAERSLQAREAARIAKSLGAKAIAHGCTAAGNDQVRFEVALRTVAPGIEILAPIRDLHPSREDELRFLQERELPVPPTGAAYSVNSGLWGTTIGGRETTGTRESLPESAWVRTRGAFDRPRPPESHTVAFARGIPSALDGVALDPVTLIERLDPLAAAFGIGRGVHLGDTILGMKGRVAFEAPAATVLLTAHRELEKLTMTGRQQAVKDQVSRTYGDLVHEGQFLEPTCRDIEALLSHSQERVTGEVFLLLRTGSLFVQGVTSPFSLRDASTSVYGEAVGEWTPEDARGFSRLLALPGALHARAGQMAAAAGAAGQARKTEEEARA